MNNDQRRIARPDALQRLRAANPSTDVLDVGTDLRARLDLDRILIGDITGDADPASVDPHQSPEDLSLTVLTRDRGKRWSGTEDRLAQPSRRRALPWIAGAAAAVVVAGVVGVAVLQPGTAPVAKAETPPALAITAPTADTPAADVLRRSADLALQQQALPAATWRYSDSIEYSTVTSFYRRDGKDVEAVQVVPSRNQFWLAADGRAHLEQVSAGGADAWSSDGEIDTSLIDSAGSSSEDLTVAGGDSALDLSTDPAALEAQLGRTDGALVGGLTARFLNELYNRARTGLPTPAQQAAMWRLLADEGTMDYLGTTTDRAGRPAVVVAYDTTGKLDGQKRYQLLLDPRTGLLLAHEEIALKTSSMWAQQAPAVMGGTTWLASASTETLDVPPSSGTSPRG